MGNSMTDQEITPEELQKFWEKFGFHDSWSDGSGSMKTYYPNGESLEVDQSGNPIYPPLTLDNLFKCAFSKAVQILMKEYNISQYEAEHLLLHNWHTQRRKGLSWEVALFRAIQEAMK